VLNPVNFAEYLEQHLFDEFEEPINTEDDQEGSESDELPDETEETEVRNNFGLRKRCPFNILQSFHAVYNFPPDLLHDLHEGVIAQDLCGIIKILSSSSESSFQVI
jgi:hypothetical protein